MSSIPDPGFPGDDGSADPEVAAALAAYAAGGDHADALAAVAGCRLLVPVVAVATDAQVDADGLTHDKSSDMATVLIARPDGRRGMLAFTSTDALAAWDRDARPVPVTARLAARAALDEGAAALLVDLAGPVRLVVDGDDLRALAAGWQLTRVGGRSGWIRPAGE